MSFFLRAVAVFVVLAALAVLAWQLAETPGEVALVWHGWRIDTSASFVAAALLAVLALGALLHAVLHGLRILPRRLAQARERRRKEAGYHALTKGMVAIAAGDAAEARRFAKRASELLGRPPGALLIGAQAAQLDGRPDQAKAFYTAMLEAKETELLGLRGLLALAEQEGDRAGAIAIAEKARALAPKAPWVLTRLFHLQIAARRWEEAETTLRQAIAARAVAEGSGKHSDAVLLVQLSLMAERNGDRALALERARRALSLDEALLPASLQLAALHLAGSEPRRARKVIEAAWRRQPHPDLARLYALALAEPDAVKRYRALAALEELAPEHAEAHRALARAALEAKLWGEARRHVKAAGETRDAGFCRLMAELAQSEGADTAAARDWLAKASESDPEPAWLCRACGAGAREWSALCGHCGDFDSLAWGQAPRVAALSAAPSGTVLASETVEAAPAGVHAAAHPAAQAGAANGGARPGVPARPAQGPESASNPPQLTAPGAPARSPDGPRAVPRS
jgi:HemY protein